MADDMLHGLKTIAAKFGTSYKTIRAWAKAGAPIMVYHNKANGRRYHASFAELKEWALGTASLTTRR